MNKQSSSKNRKIKATRAQRKPIKALGGERAVCTALIVSGLAMTAAHAVPTTIQNPGTPTNADVSLLGAGNVDAGTSNAISSLTLAPGTSLTLGGTLTLNLSGTGLVAITTTAGAGASTISGTGSLTTGSAAPLGVATASDLTIATVITGSGGLTKAGPSTLILTGSNTYLGPTSANGGILELNSAAGTAVSGSALSITSGTVLLDQSNQIASGAEVSVTTGVLALQANDNSVAGLTLTSGSITGSGTLTSTSAFDVRSGAISASLSGSVGLNKSTGGLVTLSASNTYPGGNTITGGTLEILGAGTLGSGTGSLTVNNGTLDLGTTSQTVGATAINSGTVQNGTLTTAGVTSTGGGTVSAVLAGAGGLTLNSGILTFSGSNTYTGLTTVTSGSLVLNTSGSPAISGSVQINGGTVQLDQSNQILSAQGVGLNGGVLALQSNNNTVAGLALTSGSITGSGTLSSTSAFDVRAGSISASLGGGVGLTKTTAGTVVLSGPNVYTGLTSVQGGILELNSAGSPAISGSLSITSGSVQLDRSAQILSTKGVGLNGGVLALQNNSNTVAGLTLTSGSITGSGTLSSTTDFAVSSGSISASLGGGVGLTKTTAGTVVLSGSNVYTGLTSVQGGILELNSAGNPAISGSLSITSGSVQLDRSNQIAVTQGVGVAGSVLALQNNSNTVAGLTLTSGSITGSGTLSSTTDFAVQSGSISASLGGGVGLTKTTAGTVVLSGSNVYTGLTSVQGGILELNTTAGNAVAGNLTITSGTVQWDRSNQAADNSIVTVNGGILALGANNDAIGQLVLVSGSVGGTGLLSATSDYLFQSGTVAENLGGTAGLQKTTSGTVLLTGSNSYVGTTSVQGGILELNSTVGTAISGSALSITSGTVLLDRSNQIASGQGVTLAGGVLALGANSNTVAGVTLTSGSITGSGTLASTATFAVQSGLVSASLSGSAGLAKSTGGTVTLSASNSYTGGTVVNGGLLQISGAGTLGSGTGTLAVNTTGTLDLGATTQTVGATAINGGTIQNGTLTTSGITSTGGSVSAVLTGAGGLTLNSGLLTLTAANTYTGLTLVQGGVLELNSAVNPAISGSLSITSGSVQLDRSSQLAAGQGVGVAGGVLALHGLRAGPG